MSVHPREVDYLHWSGSPPLWHCLVHFLQQEQQKYLSLSPLNHPPPSNVSPPSICSCARLIMKLGGGPAAASRAASSIVDFLGMAPVGQQGDYDCENYDVHMENMPATAPLLWKNLIPDDRHLYSVQSPNITYLSNPRYIMLLRYCKEEDLSSNMHLMPKAPVSSSHPNTQRPKKRPKSKYKRQVDAQLEEIRASQAEVRNSLNVLLENRMIPGLGSLYHEVARCEAINNYMEHSNKIDMSILPGEVPQTQSATTPSPPNVASFNARNSVQKPQPATSSLPNITLKAEELQPQQAVPIPPAQNNTQAPVPIESGFQIFEDFMNGIEQEPPDPDQYLYYPISAPDTPNIDPIMSFNPFEL
ncbi:hypothetical protein BDQ17DRAFT_1406611 [Cyathus striatus]|nr:hypothetical protein BDQ17DRAFT_1406611 [Cyathus striatus]